MTNPSHSKARTADAKHTATPWFVNRLHNDPRDTVFKKDRTVCASDNDGSVFAVAYCDYHTPELAEANAAFIVTAVNAHDDLVAALKAAHEAIELAICIANEAANEWDAAPAGMKAGKILLSLAGQRKGYSDRADKVHAALPIIQAALASLPAPQVRG